MNSRVGRAYVVRPFSDALLRELPSKWPPMIKDVIKGQSKSGTIETEDKDAQEAVVQMSGLHIDFLVH